MLCLSLQAFVQYEFPAEGGSALELSPVPGVGPGGYEGCIRLTLRYNRATRRATGFFARDIDGGRPTTIGTIRGVSAKLGSRKNPVRRPAAKAAVAAPRRPTRRRREVARSESSSGPASCPGGVLRVNGPGRPTGTDST